MKMFETLDYSINLNSPIIRISSNLLVFWGIICPGLVFFEIESMRGSLFLCLIIVHLMFFYNRLLNQGHTEFLKLFVIICTFLLIESYQVLCEGNFALFRFIIMICLGLIFFYCTNQRNDYFLPALSMICLFLFAAWVMVQFFNVELYFKPDGLSSTARAGVRFLPFPRVVLFSSPKESSILFGVMFVYFTFLYNLGKAASNSIKKFIKQSHLVILSLISLFMVIACQTISTYIFLIFHIIFLVISRMNNKSQLIFIILTFIGLLIFDHIAADMDTRYIGSYNIIKKSMLDGFVEQISSAIMIGPGIGFFDVAADSHNTFRFVQFLEATGLVPRLIFEVGLIPVLTFSLFIIMRFKEGFKYVLYISVASLPLSHYHTSYVFAILIGALTLYSKKNGNDDRVNSSPPFATVLGN